MSDPEFIARVQRALDRIEAQHRRKRQAKARRHRAATTTPNFRKM